MHYKEVCEDQTTEECSQVPKEYCNDVADRQCHTTYVDECNSVSRTICDDVPEVVERQVRIKYLKMYQLKIVWTFQQLSVRMLLAKPVMTLQSKCAEIFT